MRIEVTIKNLVSSAVVPRERSLAERWRSYVYPKLSYCWETPHSNTEEQELESLEEGGCEGKTCVAY